MSTFGYFPPFFSPALGDPEPLNAMWQETLAEYVKNRLPAFEKEILLAYLSKECGNTYCLMVHTLKLREFDMTAERIKDLPLGFDKLGIDQHLKELLSLSLRFYKRSWRRWGACHDAKENLGEHYGDCVSLMSFIVYSHRWAEGHKEEISYKDDDYARENLTALVNEARELEQVLKLR